MTSVTEKPLTKNIRPDRSVVDIRAYEQAGGYQAIRKVLHGGMTPNAVTDAVKDANLRGRGGAGFPTATEMVVRSARKRCAQPDLSDLQCR